MMCSATTRSSLELMLDSLRQKDEHLTDVPPALPARPVSKARMPPARRALPLSFQNEERESNFKVGVFESKRVKREAFVESVEGDGVRACVPISNSNRVGFGVNKIELSEVMDDTRQRALEGILEIQKYFRGHKARCCYLELKEGAITLQSFVRGENARKDYQVLTRRLAAVIVIQQHMKKWMEWRTVQKTQRAVICLQSVVRSWLTRRCLNYKGSFRLPDLETMEDMRKLDWRNPGTTDYIQVSPSAIADLQRRLRSAETELGLKGEENAAIRRQLKQLDNKWSRYEAKMKSMEKIWQDQLTSLQVSLATAKKSLTSECTKDQPPTFDPFALHYFQGANDATPMETQATDGRRAADFSDFTCDTEPQETNGRLDDINQDREQRKKVFHDNAGILGDLKSVHLASSMSPDEGLRKLKLNFKAWKKNYKTRLQETKATLQKLGPSEPKKSRRKWWGR